LRSHLNLMRSKGSQVVFIGFQERSALAFDEIRLYDLHALYFCGMKQTFYYFVVVAR
jgi:hypothetical protein